MVLFARLTDARPPARRYSRGDRPFGPGCERDDPIRFAGRRSNVDSLKRKRQRARLNTPELCERKRGKKPW